MCINDEISFPIGIGTWNIAGKFIADPKAKYKGSEAVQGNESTVQ
jgi:hypothetical protein